VRNTETNVIRTSESNAEGIYIVPNLIPGTYTLSARRPRDPGPGHGSGGPD
jgi:hypothetical protein